MLVGSRSTIASSTLSINNLTVARVISSSTPLLTSLAILITNEYISNFKIRSRKVQDWIKVITLPYEKTLKTSMVDKKRDETVAIALKKIQNHYLDKRKGKKIKR